jgi:hypothetical protein
VVGSLHSKGRSRMGTAVSEIAQSTAEMDLSTLRAVLAAAVEVLESRLL